MQISPPILFPRQDNEDYAAWVMRTMPVISHRAYPVNGVNSWHGGIHIPHTDTGALANPLRAVADGVIVYANDPAPVEMRDRKPLNYDGKTDNGCVLIRHEMLIGDDPVLCVFYSLTMHMKQVRPEIQGKVGMRVRRGQVIGTSGMVSGANAYHFQMCCSSEMLKRLCGREQGNLDVSAPGEERTAYGHRYFFLPEGTAIYAGGTPYALSASPCCLIPEALYIAHEGSKTRTLRKADGIYESVGEAAVAVDYICEPTPAISGYKTYSEWIRVAYPGGEGWVDVSSPTINTWTDADFPDWVGWTLVDDDSTPDSQCNSAMVKKALAKQDSDLTRFICKFPLEWNFASFDVRFSWLKAPNDELPEPMSDEDYASLKEHAQALCFFDKLPLENQLELTGLVWHFDPRELMIQLQKAERRLIYYSANGIKNKKMNNFTADDMRHGDLTKEQILAQGRLGLGEKFKFNLFNFNKTVEEHFASMESMAFWTAWGEYAPLIRIMLEKFRKNEGGILRHELLNKAFLEHSNTKECVTKIRGFIIKRLHSSNFCSLSKSALKAINNDIKEIRLPKFTDIDWFNGLGISIHDTFSTRIYIDNFIIDEKESGGISRKKFQVRLTFQIQDHFGLDISDMNCILFENISWFCSWFMLQRYNEYNFKPFINEANFSVWING